MDPPIDKPPVGDGGEEDYMSMTFEDTSQPKHESSLQRRERQKRQGEIRGNVKSKQDLETEAVALRETGLSTAIDTSSKGFKMLTKLGYKGGGSEPIHLAMKEDRGGIGLDSEKKRKFREETEHIKKKAREEEGDYIDRLRSEREEIRREGQIRGAQKVAEKFDAESKESITDASKVDSGGTGNAASESTPTSKIKPLTRINVLWRGLSRERLEKERAARLRYQLLDSLSSKLPTYEDPDEDSIDKYALGKDHVEVLEDVEEEDPELDEFNALDSEERLKRLVSYLRNERHYCFWCKYQYPDDQMEGCPGLLEEDHD